MLTALGFRVDVNAAGLPETGDAFGFRGDGNAVGLVQKVLRCILILPQWLTQIACAKCIVACAHTAG